MKKVTQIRVRFMKDQMRRHRAYFFVDKNDEKLYYTYPKQGWTDHPPTIDGKPLEYVSKHDDTPHIPCPFETLGLPPHKLYKIVFANVGNL
jgi:hypothetical protein